jgi:hypothetical protein
MKMRIIKIVFLLLISALLLGYGYHLYTTPSTVRAFGNLSVNFGIPSGNPLFTVTNMKPGDSELKTLPITNSGHQAQLIAVKGIRKGGSLDNPLLESVLQLTISQNGTILWGPDTLEHFFSQGTTPNGISLNAIAADETKNYTFFVSFPSASGNPFQAKSVIFDLIFGEITASDVVINEVFYAVDKKHGLDSPAERGVTVGGMNLSISGNGAGLNNNIFVDIDNNCTIYQVNNTNSNTSVDVNSSTGNNSANNNTGSTVNVKSGNTSSNVNITVIGGINKATCDNGNKSGINNEWVELYNPTDKDINLKNYYLVDNSSIPTKITANQTLKARSFVLLSKDNSTWKYWNVPKKILEIPLGRQIGDGLQNNSDHLILYNANNKELDRMSWGTDVSGFTPPATNAAVPAGNSIERIIAGVDTDTVSDWHANSSPTPGK